MKNGKSNLDTNQEHNKIKKCIYQRFRGIYLLTTKKDGDVIKDEAIETLTKLINRFSQSYHINLGNKLLKCQNLFSKESCIIISKVILS